MVRIAIAGTTTKVAQTLVVHMEMMRMKIPPAEVVVGSGHDSFARTTMRILEVIASLCMRMMRVVSRISQNVLRLWIQRMLPEDLSVDA